MNNSIKKHNTFNNYQFSIINYQFKIIVILIILLLAGCAKKIEPEIKKPISLWEQEISTYEEQLANKRNVQREAPPKQPLQPRFKSLNPLDTERLSISVVGQHYEQVLQILAHTAALNLIISPQTTAVLGDSTLLTVEFQEMTVRQILDAVSRILNIAWSEENNSIFIEPFISKNISLDFLGTVRQSSFEVGGSVLGGGGGDASPLSGRFVIQGGTTDIVTDIYTNIEASLARILGGGGGGGADGDVEGAAAETGNNSFFVLNRQTGHLLVRCRPETVNEIENFINHLREKYRRQVLIEAKIIEVGLDQHHALGIDWRSVNAFISRTALRTAGVRAGITPVIGGKDSFYAMTISSKYSDISTIFHALEQYGRLSVLSNPRLKAMNGQSAIMSVGQSVAYLASVTRSVDDEGVITYTTETGSVFDGVLLGITPVIESDGIITLHIVPIKSNLVELDNISIGRDLQITLPSVNLREMSTVARVRSGDIVLLGGLIMESGNIETTGLPVLGDIPFLGRLFQYQTDTRERVELVVALQVTVVEK